MLRCGSITYAKDKANKRIQSTSCRHDELLAVANRWMGQSVYCINITLLNSSSLIDIETERERERDEEMSDGCNSSFVPTFANWHAREAKSGRSGRGSFSFTTTEPYIEIPVVL
jgi:hypothetical protein